MPAITKQAIRFTPSSSWQEFYFKLNKKNPDLKCWVTAPRVKSVNSVDFSLATLYSSTTDLSNVVKSLEKNGHTHVEIITVTCTY